MITRKSTYALRALTEMAREPRRLYSVAELAQKEGIPKAYLTLILATLRRHGILAGLRGPSGGYGLPEGSARISLAQVIDILDGPLFFPVACLGPNAGACAECPENGCAARSALRLANRAARQALESMSIGDLTSLSPPPPSSPG